MKVFLKSFESLAGLVALIGGGAALALWILDQQIGLRIPLIVYDLNSAVNVAMMAAIMAFIARFAAWACGK